MNNQNYQIKMENFILLHHDNTNFSIKKISWCILSSMDWFECFKHDTSVNLSSDIFYLCTFWVLERLTDREPMASEKSQYHLDLQFRHRLLQVKSSLYKTIHTFIVHATKTIFPNEVCMKNCLHLAWSHVKPGSCYLVK